MSNNILLLQKDEVFEPHVYPEKTLPFVFNVSRTSGSYSANLHEDPEFLYFMEGTASVRCGDLVYSVSAGDFVAVDSYEIHRVLPEGQICYAYLIPSCDFLRANGLDVTLRSFSSLLREEDVSRRFVRIIKECSSRDPFRAAAIRSSILDLTVYLCRNYSQPRTAPALLKDASFDCVRRAIEFMKSSYRERLTVDRIAEAAGLSKYHFLRRFKRITGHTVVEYLNSVRCEYAKQRLLGGSDPVKQIALECGFENTSYFTAVFRRYTGMLPSECRKKQ